jgi:hypothetical protein
MVGPSTNLQTAAKTTTTQNRPHRTDHPTLKHKQLVNTTYIGKLFSVPIEVIGMLNNLPIELVRTCYWQGGCASVSDDLFCVAVSAAVCKFVEGASPAACVFSAV